MRTLAVVLLIAAPAAAQTGERETVAMAAERGRLIHAYDRAAWLATDDMLAKVRDPASKVAGYLAEGPAEAPRLTFFDRSPTPRAFYVAQLRDDRLVSGRILRPDEDRALSADGVIRLKALAVATAAIRAAGLRPCGSAQFNTVVLPVDPATGAVRVYFLTPQADTAHVPFGGHYAIEVAADGGVGRPRAFTRACLSMPTRPLRGEPVAVTVSHVLDPTPTEIHVFASLTTGRPVYVLTTQPTPRLWTVTGDRIDGPRPISGR